MAHQRGAKLSEIGVGRDCFRKSEIIGPGWAQALGLGFTKLKARPKAHRSPCVGLAWPGFGLEGQACISLHGPFQVLITRPPLAPTPESSIIDLFGRVN
jgi:hypothetical protein